jgi:hypothetical protein
MVEEMACSELVEVVTDYLDRALPAEELTRVRDHRAAFTHGPQVTASVLMLARAVFTALLLRCTDPSELDDPRELRIVDDAVALA